MDRTSRLTSIDFVRGVVMVLMAIDHVRVYSGQPAGGPEPGIFFTRWVTHFCAPAFAFLAGMGAYLYGRKVADPSKLARFLVTRGLILVVLELTLIKFTWTFRLDYSQTLAGVIWMLGWCMVLLAAFVRLQPTTVGAIGLGTIVFQQAFGLFPRIWPQSLKDIAGWLWEFVYPAGLHGLDGVAILYVLVPWIGVMALGYGMGQIATFDATRRRSLFIRIGLAATVLFLLTGTVAVSFAARPPNAPPALFQLLNQQKYPASQLFLLMTLGPTILLLGLADTARGKLAEIFITFGRVPMFYYLLHIPLIHLAAFVTTLSIDGAIHPDWYAYAPFTEVPREQRWSLPLLYLVFAIVVAILYFPCRWMAAMKQRRGDAWLSIL